MDHAQPQSDESLPVGSGHEPSEVGIRRIFVFGAALTVLTVVVMICLGLVMRLFKTDEKQLGVSRPELFKIEAGQFPSPNLQRDDEYEMKQYRETERAALASYGWVDAKEGIARIPIDRALDILAERGLPKAKPKPAPAPASAEPSKK